MVESHTYYNEHVHAFHEWRQSSEACSPGIRGPNFGAECTFIPRSKLEDYFATPRLERLLDTIFDNGQGPRVNANYIRDHYLRSFAILLCIGEESKIHHFQQYDSLNDEKLPHNSRPEDYPHATPDKFEEFRKEQWQFCASKLKYNMGVHFKEEHILPIIHKKQIGTGGSSIVYKIVVDEEYNQLRPHHSGGSHCSDQFSNTFVLKTYREGEAGENYRVEREAYMKLRYDESPLPAIIAYYGGFVHGKSYNNIFEFADGGTLEDYMRDTASPEHLEDTFLVWDRLFSLMHGLMAIHNVGNEGHSSHPMNGWHQDIKPANILVFGGGRTSPYDRDFKIADLGHTHFKASVPQQNDPLDLDALGTRAYGAPETWRSHTNTEFAPLQITRSVDIWSIGCVFSEAAVWARHGWKKVDEYRRKRSSEIEDAVSLQGEFIFHNDGNLLKAVEDIHQDILNPHPASHRITRILLDRFIMEMLQHDPHSRPPAHLLSTRPKDIIRQEAKKTGVSLGHPESISDGGLIKPDQNGNRSKRKLPPVEPPPSDEDFLQSSCPRSQLSHKHQHRLSRISNDHNIDSTGTSHLNGQNLRVSDPPIFIPATNPSQDHNSQQSAQTASNGLERPYLSLDEGLEWKERKKNGYFAPLTGDANMTTLNKRDHIFLIDNSSTMQPFKSKVGKVISLLAYMLKGSDEDGLDIFFTQSLHKVNSKRSSKLTSAIDAETFHGISDMRGRLQSLLQEHINKFGTMVPSPKKLWGHAPPQPQRPLSFYILTDAKWQPTDVGALIKYIVECMKAKRLPKEHVAFSFIRFGEDQASIEKLNVLDSGLGLKATGMDIVDHTCWNGNIWKQLLGPINDWYDDDPP